MNLKKAIVVSMVVMASQGCVAFYTKRPVTIEVIDVATQKPVEHLTVRVHYGYVMVLNAPDDVEGTTGHGGAVTLELADFKNGSIALDMNYRSIRLSTEMVRNGAQFECQSYRSTLLVTMTPN